MKPFINFRSETRRLLTLHNAGVYSFTQESKRIKQKIYNTPTDFDPQLPIYLNDEEDESMLLSGSAYELAEKFKKQFQKNIREVLLVRLISTLEVFLVDMVREVFLKRKDLFHSNSKIEFSQNELLASDSITSIWTKIINKECRRLQNQGLIETKKFYYKNFDIDFNNFSEKISTIQKIHDIRHLLVHRLGKTDNEYRHKYNTKQRAVNVSSEVFYEAVNTIKAFGEFINKECLVLISNSNIKQKTDSKTNAYLKVFWLSDDEPSVFDKNYSFFVEDNFIRLRDIVKNISYNEQEVEIEFIGNTQFIRSYFKTIKKLEKAGELKILKKSIRSDKRNNVTINVMELVGKELSEQPFPLDIHKTIANKLNLKPALVYDAIRKIIETSTLNNGS